MEAAETNRSFVADVTSPEPLRLYLYHDAIERSSFGSLDWLGWRLVVNKVSPAGEELAFGDHWEDTLLEVLRYPEDYSDMPLLWRWESSGEPADLRTLQPNFDARRRFETALKAIVSPDGTQRLCFNLYDNQRYRFTLEELIREGELAAWVPREWSREYVDMSGAEEAARLTYEWFS